MPRNPFLQFLLSLFMLKKHDDLLVLHKHGKHQNCHEQFNFAKNIAGSHVRGFSGRRCLRKTPRKRVKNR